MSSIELTKSQADAVERALRHWSQTKLISASLRSDLIATIQIVEDRQHGFDWDRFAKYSFRLSVICLVVALISLAFDNVFPRMIKKIMSLPASVRITLTSASAVAVHLWGYGRSLAVPAQVYLDDAIHAIGALLFGLAALQLVVALDANERKNMHVVCRAELALASVYGCTAVLVRSNFIWSCAMLIIGSWFGSWTAYRGGKNFLGMNYPSRAVLCGAGIIEGAYYPLRFGSFGAGIVGCAYLMRRYPLSAALWSTTRIWGMLYLFFSLWILSLVANDELPERVLKTGRPARKAVWSLVFLGAAMTAIWHGLRYGDSTTKGFGLAFVGINLYSNFFDFAWSRVPKPVVFALMAVSLALVGKYAESMNIVLQQRFELR